jgi:thiol-disulfide isomerase/thioredoxin
MCWEALDRDAGGPNHAGAMPGCRTPAGAYDLAGNLQEWVGAEPAQAILVGGAWYYEDKANCGASYDAFGPGYSNRSTGFRCCADRPVGGDVLVASAAGARPAEATQEGQPVPAFSGATPDGGTVGSETIAGKVALVNFWASWCGPCQRELPALKAVQDEFAARGFTVIAVNVDKEPALADRLIARVQPNYPILLDPESEVMGAFDVMAMPTSVLIDREGRMVKLHTGFSEAWIEELRAQIESLL